VTVFMGGGLIGWLFRAVVAVFVFLLLRWLIPLLAGLVGLSIPEVLVVLFCAVVALAILFYPYLAGYSRARTP
jgi:hypothetical protein